ncbi:MAG: hypothetical protein M1812_005627 [Candelaria pacifica]|nr:MAG: hypothetical protein M1812_005627 [Candelaria pacifica]
MAVANGSADGPTSVSSAEERMRQQQIEDAMFADLGLARREQISTEDDRRKGKAREHAQVTRLSDQVGTKEHRLARLNKTGTDLWKTAYLDMDRDEAAEKLEDLGQGQSHRAALTESLKPSGHHEPSFSGRGGRARGGGRGGGVIGSRGRGGGSAALITFGGPPLSTSTPKSFGPQDAGASSNAGNQNHGPRARGKVNVSVRTASGNSRNTPPQAASTSRASAATPRGKSNLGSHTVRHPAAKSSFNTSQKGRAVHPPQTRAAPGVPARSRAPRPVPTAPHSIPNYESHLTSGAEWMRARNAAFGVGDKALTTSASASTAQESALSRSIHAPPVRPHAESSVAPKQNTLPTKVKNPQEAISNDANQQKAALPTVVEPPIQQPPIKQPPIKQPPIQQLPVPTRSIQESASTQSALGPRSRRDFGVSNHLQRLTSLSNPSSQARTISSRVSDVSGSQALLSDGQEDPKSQRVSAHGRAESLLSSDLAPAMRPSSANITSPRPSSPIPQTYLDDLEGLDFSQPVKPAKSSPAYVDEPSGSRNMGESLSDIPKPQKQGQIVQGDESSAEPNKKIEATAAAQGEQAGAIFDPGFWATFLPTMVNMTSIGRTQALKKLGGEVQRALQGEQEILGVSARGLQVPQESVRAATEQIAPKQTIPERAVSEQTVSEQAISEQVVSEQAFPERAVSKQNPSPQIIPTQSLKTKVAEEVKPRTDMLEDPEPQHDAITPAVPLSKSIHAYRLPPPQSNVSPAGPSSLFSTWASQYADIIADNVIGDIRNVRARTNTTSTTLSSPVTTGVPALTSYESGTMQSRFAPQARRPSTLSTSTASTVTANQPTINPPTSTTRNTTWTRGTPILAPVNRLQSNLASALPTNASNQPSTANLSSAASSHAPTTSVISPTKNSNVPTSYEGHSTQTPRVVPATITPSSSSASAMPGQPNTTTSHENLPLRINTQERSSIPQSVLTAAPLSQSSTSGLGRDGFVSANALTPRSPNRPQQSFGGSSQESRFADTHTPPSPQLQTIQDAVQKSAAAKEEEDRRRSERTGTAKSKWSQLH